MVGAVEVLDMKGREIGGVTVYSPNVLRKVERVVRIKTKTIYDLKIGGNKTKYVEIVFNNGRKPMRINGLSAVHLSVGRKYIGLIEKMRIIPNGERIQIEVCRDVEDGSRTANVFIF